MPRRAWTARDDFTVSADLSRWFSPHRNPKTIVSGGTTYWYVGEAFTQAHAQLRWRPSASAVPILNGSTQFLAGIRNVFDQMRLNAFSTRPAPAPG